MEHLSLVFGIVVCVFAGAFAQESKPTVSVNRTIVVKPTPDPLNNAADRVDITLTCTGSRTDLSYYIQNQIGWSFTSKTTGNVKNLSKQSFYLDSEDMSTKYKLIYQAVANGFEFAIKISGVTYSDDGIYTCALLNSGLEVVDKKEVPVIVTHPVDSVKLSLKKGNTELFSTTQPAAADQAANKLKPGMYKAKCSAMGSNPEPEIHLMMNGEKFSGAQASMSHHTKTRPSFMRNIEKTYDLSHKDMEQVLSCEANIPGNMYDPVVSSMKLKVEIIKPTIKCKNVTRSIGDNYVPIECTITSQSDVMCEMVSWQFGDRNEVIELGEAVKDAQQKYDIVKAECTATDANTITTTLTLYKANAAHFKAVYYVNYGVGADLHRHPISINLDNTTSGTTIVVPLSMLMYVVMAAMSKLL